MQTVLDFLFEVLDRVLLLFRKRDEVASSKARVHAVEPQDWDMDITRAPRIFKPQGPLHLADMFVRILGPEDKSKVPLILVHGVNSSSKTFESLAKRLSADRTVILYDFRGHGGSKDPGPGYDVDVLSEDLLLLMNSLNIPKAILHGHSVGATVALGFALHHPDRVHALSLEDMSGMPYKARTSKYMIDASFTIRHLRGMRPLYRSRRVFLKEARPLLVDRPAHFGAQLLAKAKVFDKYAWSPTKGAATEEILLDTSTRDLSAAFVKYQGPLLIMKAGIHSRYLSEEHLQKIQQMRPDAQVDWIHQSGHSIHVEQPEAWLKSLQRFLKSTNETGS